MLLVSRLIRYQRRKLYGSRSIAVKEVVESWILRRFQGVRCIMFKTLSRGFVPVAAAITTRSLPFAVLFGASFYLMSSQPVESVVSSVAIFRPRQVIVQLKPGALVDPVNDRNDTTIIKRLAGTDFYLLRVAEGIDESVAVNQLKQDASVADASLNRVLQSPFTSLSQSIMSFPDGYAVPHQSESDYKLQAQFLDGQLNLAAAHLRSRGAGTTVAVIDTGIDRTHPVLTEHLWVDDRDTADVPGNGIDDDLDGLVDDAYGWDLVNNDGDPTELPDDPQTTVAGHGTFIAGLIAILAPDCRIMPIRAFSPPGESDEFTVAEAIKWATDHGADVVNMSFGTPDDSSILRSVIEYAFQQNVIMASAVGNEATETPPLYPAHYYDWVMGVTAVDSSDKIAFFSNYGAHTSMSGLGKSIISTYPGSDYALWSGTSFSTPLVVAEAALLISADRNSHVTRQIIEQTALNIDNLNGGFAGLIGKGRLRPLNALKALSTSSGLNPTLDLESMIEMTSGGGFPNAKGSAEVYVTVAVQEFRIIAHGLAPGSAYRLAINGQLQPGSFTAGKFGNIKVVMSSNPGATAIQLPDEFQPVTRIDGIELQDGLGRLVLSGDFDPVFTIAQPNQSLLKEARLSAPPQSSSSTTLSLSVSAMPTGTSGNARVEVDSERQIMSINLETTTPDATYHVFVDGVSLGLVTSQSGSISVSYSSDGSASHSIPAAITPLCNARQVRIIDSLGKVVAQGTFRIPGANLGTG